MSITATQAGHGIGKTLVLKRDSRPFTCYQSDRPDPRADETHVVVGVTDPTTRQPIVSDVEVLVSLTAADDPTVILRETGHGQRQSILLRRRNSMTG